MVGFNLEDLGSERRAMHRLRFWIWLRRVGLSLCLSVSFMSEADTGIRTVVSVDFDDEQVFEASGRTSFINPRGADKLLATVDKGTRFKVRPTIASQKCHSPPNCLQISIDPSSKGAAKNKIMYSFWSHYKPLPGGERGRLRIGDNRTTRVRFAMKLDEHYDTPLHQMIHFQIYQPRSTKKAAIRGKFEAGGPVLSMRIVPHSRKQSARDGEEFIIVVRSPEAHKLHYYDRRDKGVLFRGPIRKGEWNNFSFALQSSDRDGRMIGRVGFWLNDVKKVDHSVEWGFDPNRYGVSEKLGFELGSYRSADPTGHQTVYFDDIRLDR